jgi:PhzF family phenazine biosynthesis protein
MNLPLYQVDAFTGRLFAGNPAAVVLCETELSASLMQSIAAENNLAETAFVVNEGGQFQIRWFTPTVEVDLCGHATLAAAHVIFNHLAFSGERITFSSKSGPLYVRQDAGILFLDFPADMFSEDDAPESLVDGLAMRPRETYKGRDDYLAIFENQDDIVSLRPDMSLISKVPSRGVIVSSPGRDVDFVSRFFAPQCGIPEDPVTGSAHTMLIPYWSKRLDKKQLSARQLSERGGELVCRDLGSRVEIGGRAITYLIGQFSC